jgi:hypothetical protein
MGADLASGKLRFQALAVRSCFRQARWEAAASRNRVQANQTKNSVLSCMRGRAGGASMVR